MKLKMPTEGIKKKERKNCRAVFLLKASQRLYSSACKKPCVFFGNGGRFVYVGVYCESAQGLLYILHFGSGEEELGA